jgi:hypothetical protein
MLLALVPLTAIAAPSVLVATLRANSELMIDPPP